MADRESRGERGAVAAGHRAEVEAGLAMLAQGGNAVDAVVAGAFCACVVEPNNAGLAGYGHLTAWLPQERAFLTVDHGPRAPAAAHERLFPLSERSLLDREVFPTVEGDVNAIGGLATGTPGAVPGLCAAHARAGRLPLAVVLEPAIAAADAGVPIDWHLGLTILQRLHEIRLSPSAAAVLLVDGDPPSSHDDWGRGARLDTSALVDVLRAIAADGAAAFADPALAGHVERAVAAQGGILTAADIAAYVPRSVLEQPTRYGGFALATSEDDCGHELFAVLERLGVREHEPLSADALHLVAEAFGHVLADTLTWAGDPEAAAEVSAVLRSGRFADARAAAIRPDRAAPRPVAAGSLEGLDDPGTGAGGTSGTTQVAAIDHEGNAAVVITTIGRDFGSLVHVPELGLFLNTAMANFDPRPGRTNSIAPGRMPLFGVPAVVAVEGEDAFLACGGSGGYRITSGVVHATVNVLDHDLSAAEAVAAPRVWCQGDETYVDERLPEAVREALAERGHAVVVEELTPAYEPFARVSLVRRHPDGSLEAASDPPWHGAAGAI